jgi:hypothetical protein
VFAKSRRAVDKNDAMAAKKIPRHKKGFCMKKSPITCCYLFGVLLACVGFLVTCVSGPKTVEGTDIPVNNTKDFVFYHGDKKTDWDNGIHITKYLGESTVVGIPARIKGKPVISINRGTFQEKGLTAVGIPSSVKMIEGSAFEKNKLSNIVLPEGLVNLGGFAENQLTEITIPGSVKRISDYAFAGNQLTEIIIPDGVTLIGKYAFANNKLTNITIPNSVVEIGDNIVAGNSLSVQLVIPDSVKTIRFGEGFAGQIYKQGESRTITITKSYGIVTYTGGGSKVIIPGDVYGIPVTAIEANAFYHDKYVISIDELILPASLAMIGSNAFKTFDFKKVSPANDAIAALWNEYKVKQDQVDAQERQKKAKETEESLRRLQDAENTLRQLLR